MARLTAALWVAILAGSLMWTWITLFPSGEPHAFFDADYYRNAVIDVAAGTKSMYDALPYPPFAFLVVWFLGDLPPQVGYRIWTVGSLLILLAVTLVLALRSIAAAGRDWRHDLPGLIVRTSAGTVMLLFSLPVMSQLGLGQLSLAIMALSFVDVVGVLPRRYRGILVGVAGAIKVTPMVFVLYYLVNRLWREAATATVTFLAATGAAWMVFPRGSEFFWFHLGKSDVFGDPARIDNLSIHGSISRWSTALGQSTWLWGGLGVVVVCAAMWRARRHFLRSERMEAVLVVGASATVVGPIAWPHYLTWLPVAGLWMVMTRGRTTKWLGGIVCFTYSIAYVALFLPHFRPETPATNAATRSAIDLLVVIPMLIGLFGLPHRAPPTSVDARQAETFRPSFCLSRACVEGIASSAHVRRTRGALTRGGAAHCEGEERAPTVGHHSAAD